ncbi:MAG: ArsR family transcriptional regulator [Pyrobaculum sp.]|nr:ArsR family transcriptional regulator [Pyrobaculum sp.]
MLKLISACRLDEDQLLSEVLRYIILKGPATAYRIARDLNLHFTQAYRKAARLERFGMARRAANHRGSMFEATERGIVMCYYFGCDNWEILINKLAARHRLPGPVLRAFLDTYLDHFKNDAVVEDIPVMAFYAAYRGMEIPQELASAVARFLPKAAHVSY